uniref:RNase H family protein n=1 Tax=Solanum tuberosum TaxID=4113 RepID=M1DB97_SOLTU
MHSKHKVEEHIQWKLNSGNCSFWWDDWLGIGPLAQYSTVSNRLNNTKVAEFWMEGQWNLNMLIQQAPHNYLANILATELHIQHDIPDQACWKLNSDGNFTCSSAWNEIREKRTKTAFNNFCWHKSIPFKASFLLWRTLRGKIPTNEKLISFGIERANCFCCCNRTGLDTIEHIFNNGHFATCVWKSFAAAAGVNTDHSSISQLIMQWCASKYGGKHSNISRVKYAIYKDIYKLMTTTFHQIKWPTTWRELFQLGERCIHNIKVTCVKWIKPPDQWVKINTDGSALINPGRIGAGGIIRNQDGEMILAFATPLGEGSNNLAELRAAVFGMSWLIHLGYKNVILEVDSQLLVDWITLKAKPPWSINTQLQQLQRLINQTNNFRSKHTLREANNVADSLSKQSHKITCPQIYCNNQQLPREARAYYQLDMLGMASFRRRKIKRIKEPP